MGRCQSEQMHAGQAKASLFMSPTQIQTVLSQKRGSSTSPADSTVQKSSASQEITHLIKRPNNEVEDQKLVLQVYVDLLKDEPESEDWKSKVKATRLKIIALIDNK